MSDTRAYIEQVADDRANVAVYEDVTMYGGRRGKDPVLSEQYTLEDDGVDHLFGAEPEQPFAEPEQPFAEADRILAAHGWKRGGGWVVGDAITGIYARVARTKHVVQGCEPVSARFITRA